MGSKIETTKNTDKPIEVTRFPLKRNKQCDQQGNFKIGNEDDNNKQKKFDRKQY